MKITNNESTMNLTITYTPITIGNLRLILHVKSAMESLKRLGFSDKDVDEVKGIYSDTNVYLLTGTVFIASMHVSYEKLNILFIFFLLFDEK